MTKAEETRKKKAFQLRYKKPIVKDLNLWTIKEELDEISCACDDVRYYWARRLCKNDFSYDMCVSFCKQKQNEGGKDNNWASINLPENCTNICLSFKREIAELQIEKFGAKPLYGFENKKEEWLPAEVFITCGGSLAPDQRRQEV